MFTLKVILSQFVALFIGLPLPVDSPYRFELNKYKSKYLYDENYEQCTYNTQTKIFDEPLKCLSSDYISHYVNLIRKDKPKENLYMADGLHPEYSIRGANYSISTLSNRDGEVFFVRFNMPYEQITLNEVELQARTLTKMLGAPSSYDESPSVDYKWITSDGFDVNLKSGVKGYSLEYIDREGYDSLNSYISAKLNNY